MRKRSFCAYGDYIPPIIATITALVAVAAALYWKSTPLTVLASLGTCATLYTLRTAFQARNLTSLREETARLEKTNTDLVEQITEQRQVFQTANADLQAALKELKELLCAMKDVNANSASNVQEMLKIAQNVEQILASLDEKTLFENIQMLTNTTRSLEEIRNILAQEVEALRSVRSEIQQTVRELGDTRTALDQEKTDLGEMHSALKTAVNQLQEIILTGIPATNASSESPPPDGPQGNENPARRSRQRSPGSK